MIDIDFETRSAADISSSGAWKYGADPSTSVLCMAYKINDEETKLWVPSNGPPPDWCFDITKIAALGGIRAHNASFEQAIWASIMVKVYGCTDIPPKYWYDTMAQCAAASIPLSLGEAGKVMGLKVQKDEEGRRVMLQLSQKRIPSASNPKIWWEPEDVPDKFATLYKYCINDVDTQAELAASLPELSDEERQVWILDQRINQRGLKVDRTLAERCVELISAYIKTKNERVKLLTGVSVYQVALLRNWVESRGVEAANLTKNTIEELLAKDNLPADVREVVEIRQALSKSSVKKLDAMLACSDLFDSRVRYTAVYHGASTGRWAGRLIQPQNFPSRFQLDKEKHGFDMDMMIEYLLTKSLDEILAICAVANLDIMDVVSACLRGFITTDDGMDLVQADYSNIEGRILAWISGEEWKVQAFKEFDAGTGPDLYKLAYSRSFNVPVDEVTKAQRQIGKVMELALGYGGGAGAFRNMAKGYGVRLSPMFDYIWGSINKQEQNSALKMFELCLERNKKVFNGDPYDVKEYSDFEDFRKEFLACEIIKAKWRKAHPKVTAYWKALEKAAIDSVLTPGESKEVDKVSFLFDKERNFLYCTLPSGRKLSYPQPTIRMSKRVTWNGDVENTYALEYMGINSMNRQWSTQHSYGGHLCENVCQAVARDCLVEGMFMAEATGYQIVMTVHDEIVTEVKEGFGSVEEFEEFICTMPEWADGLPLTSEGWRAKRYRK